MKRILTAITAIALLAGCTATKPAGEVTDVQTLKSPDGVLEMTFQLTAEGTPQYALNYEGKQIILPSNLGFELRGNLKAEQLVYNSDGTISKVDYDPEIPFYEGFSVEGVETDSFDETWEPIWGEEAKIRNNYNELVVNLIHKSTDRRMSIRFRLYDDGLGFRYEFPYQKNLSYFVIKEEHTEFAMAGDHMAGRHLQDGGLLFSAYVTGHVAPCVKFTARRRMDGAGNAATEQYALFFLSLPFKAWHAREQC